MGRRRINKRQLKIQLPIKKDAFNREIFITEEEKKKLEICDVCLREKQYCECQEYPTNEVAEAKDENERTTQTS